MTNTMLVLYELLTQIRHASSVLTDDEYAMAQALEDRLIALRTWAKPQLTLGVTIEYPAEYALETEVEKINIGAQLVVSDLFVSRIEEWRDSRPDSNANALALTMLANVPSPLVE